MKKGVVVFGLFLFTFFAQAQVPVNEALTKSGRSSGPTASGYIDVQFQWGRGSQDLSSGTGEKLSGEPTGFSVYQGAVMLADEIEKAEFFLDLPFRQRSKLETLVSGGLTVSGSDNGFDLALQDAQGFVKYQFDAGLFWQLGQFDSSFGLEGNDSSDLIFSQFGILQPMTPNTHTGLQIGYTFLPYFFSFTLGNGDSLGVASTQVGPQFGLRLGWSQEPYQFSVGVLHSRPRGTYQLSSGENIEMDPTTLFNAVLTTTLKRLEYGVELNVGQSRYGTAFVRSSRQSHDLILGYLLQVSYAINDKTLAGVRFEQTQNEDRHLFIRYADSAQNSPTFVGQRTGQGGRYQKISIGFRRVLNEEVSLKAGLEFVSLNIGKDDPNPALTQNWSQGTIGSVYVF